MNPLLNVLLVFVILFIYFNTAWFYLYSFGGCENWFSKFISLGKKYEGGDEGQIFFVLVFAYLLWPLALATAILYWALWRTVLYWILWLIFGGAARTIVGKSIDGNPLKPTEEKETETTS